MPDPIPADDLYARLGVPREADGAAIDRAWRALLKQHHPDVAGSVSLELAKQINVAHDWLSDPVRRARYDAATSGPRPRPGRPSRSGGAAAAAAPSPAADPARRTRPAAPRPASGPAAPDDLDVTFGTSAVDVRAFLAQAAALTPTDVDRLSVTDAVDPSAEFRDVMTPELWARVEAVDARLASGVPALRGSGRALAAARAYGHAAVLDLFLRHYLLDAETLLDEMRRAWESAVGLPRYGPNTAEVEALLARLATLSTAGVRELAASWRRLGDPLPWPADAWEFDFSALEVSSALARRDAAAVAGRLADRLPARDAAEARTWEGALESTAHVATLRPIFPPRTFAPYDRLTTALLGPRFRGAAAEAPQPTVRRA